MKTPEKEEQSTDIAEQGAAPGAVDSEGTAQKSNDSVPVDETKPKRMGPPRLNTNAAKHGDRCNPKLDRKRANRGNPKGNPDPHFGVKGTQARADAAKRRMLYRKHGRKEAKMMLEDPQAARACAARDVGRLEALALSAEDRFLNAPHQRDRDRAAERLKDLIGDKLASYRKLFDAGQLDKEQHRKRDHDEFSTMIEEIATEAQRRKDSKEDDPSAGATEFAERFKQERAEDVREGRTDAMPDEELFPDAVPAAPLPKPKPRRIPAGAGPAVHDFLNPQFDD